MWVIITTTCTYTCSEIKRKKKGRERESETPADLHIGGMIAFLNSHL